MTSNQEQTHSPSKGREQKMLGFLHVLKPIKRQDLLEEGKNGRNAFPTCAKIHFNKNKILELKAL